jgi:glycosyltransferase involved in cell wall biosynthesis
MIMILYLEMGGGSRRGGEIYHHRLFQFLKQKFGETGVVGREPFPSKLTGALSHLLYNRRRVKEVRPRLVVVDIGTATRSLAAIMKARRLGAEILLVVQGERRLVLREPSLRLHIVKRCERYLLRHARIVMVNSSNTGALAESRGAQADKIVVARPGLECRRLPSRPSCPSEPPLKLLYVGAYSRVKGLLPLIEAMALLKDTQIELDVVGEKTRESDYWIRIQQVIESHRLSGRVRFHPFQDRKSMDGFYRRSHVLVAPSLFEGYGMVVAEAFCYGLPVIASEVGALPELVVHEQNGLLVPPADPAGLASSIRRLAEDKALRAKMSETNFERAGSLPDWADFETTLEQNLVPLIEPILTGPRS